MHMDGADKFQPPSQPPPLLTVDQVRQLCEQGHLGLDLPPHLASQYESLFSRITEFFDLPLDQKTALYPSVPTDTEQGYHHLPSEKEYLTFRFIPPIASQDEEQPAAWSQEEAQDLVAQTWQDTSAFLLRILWDISSYLGGPPSGWRDLIRDSIKAASARDKASPTIMRLFRYEPLGGIAEAHRDLGLLTMCVCRGKGLQVWQRPTPDINSPPPEVATDGQPQELPAANVGQWLDAPSVTILAGDTLRVLTSNHVAPGMHRVEGTDEGRQSIVFALRPSVRGTIDLASFGGDGSIEAKALWARIKGRRFNVNWQKSVKDEFRAKMQNGAERSIA